jgi:hypothetical protein
MIFSSFFSKTSLTRAVGTVDIKNYTLVQNFSVSALFGTLGRLKVLSLHIANLLLRTNTVVSDVKTKNLFRTVVRLRKDDSEKFESVLM